MSDLRDELVVSTADEESPFSRDIDGYLVHLDAPTAEKYRKLITLTIDGREFTVPEAVPTRDACGGIVYRDGETIPRATTIYDAACQHHLDIPILCHQPHLRPVAVCRVCSVLVKRPTDRRDPTKLVPACQHRVEKGMVVHTRKSPEQGPRELVDGVVKTLIELLQTENQSDNRTVDNEVRYLAGEFGVEASRLPEPSLPRRADFSSLVIDVDHNACILCDRCVRGCNEVRGNFVIGRNGKGYATRIGFDLGDSMSDSSCVSCGECAISCPTGALTIKKTVNQPPRDAPGAILGVVDVNELLEERDESLDNSDRSNQPLPLVTLFGALPRKLLQWNAGAVYRRQLAPGDVLFHEGEYGSHAFLLEKGSLTAEVKSAKQHFDTQQPGNFLSRMLGRSVLVGLSRGARPDEDPRRPRSIRTDMGVSVSSSEGVTILYPGMGLIGESACLNNYPYGTTVTAVKPSTVLEIRRNLVLHLMRTPEARQAIIATYRTDALASYGLLHPLLAALGLTPQKKSLGSASLSMAESKHVASRMAQQVEFVRVDPGQPIFVQGDAADFCYQVRIGFVRVAQTRGLQEIVLDYIGAGGVIGADELLLSLEGPTARRGCTYRALDHVELVRIPGQAFRELMNKDSRVRTALEQAAAELTRHLKSRQDDPDESLDEYLNQGLYHARRLLVLDLDKCTRCDECTRACADTHGGTTRLIREGLRFENFLVTTSCRSCLDPVCLVGCPVDAIHRKGNAAEIEIEDWCIGCGLCANSCPYGNIHMAAADERPEHKSAPEFKATTCDLCHKLSPNSDPSCVYACPHDAAHRINGEDLLKRVRERQPKVVLHDGR